MKLDKPLKVYFHLLASVLYMIQTTHTMKETMQMTMIWMKVVKNGDLTSMMMNRTMMTILLGKLEKVRLK